MTVKTQYTISVIYLCLFLIFIIISMKPVDQPFLDGELYYKIAAEYKSFLKGEMGDLNYLHRDRMLPATTAGVIADIFNIPVQSAFRILSLSVVILFYIFTFYLLAGKVTNIAAMTGLWLCYTINSVSITYNLYNIYQLVDSMAYLWTALIVISFVNRNIFLFIPISILAMITKQHLWSLVLPGYLFFIIFYHKIKDIKKFRLSLIFGLVITSIILIMFFTEAEKIRKMFLLQIFDVNIYRGKIFYILEALFWIYLPVLPVMLIKYKSIYKKSLEYFPLVLFFIITFIIVIPLSLLLGMDFYTRILMQVIWPVCAYTIVLIVNDFDRWKNKYFLWVLYLAPVLYGIEHLSFFTIKFKPLFIFPSTFRHLLTLFLLTAYLTKSINGKYKNFITIFQKKES